VRIPREVEG